MKPCKNCGLSIQNKYVYCAPCSPKARFMALNCLICNKEIRRRQSELSEQNFCSIKCRGEHFMGSNNPNYKHGLKTLATMIRESSKMKMLKKYILARDDYICAYCDQRGGELTVDHINKFKFIFDDFLGLYIDLSESHDKWVLFKLALKHAAFWDEDNLQVLCKKCNWTKELSFRRNVKEKRLALNISKQTV